MEKQLKPGAVRIGHTQSINEGTYEVVFVEFDNEEVVVKWPQILESLEEFKLVDDEDEIPEPLIFEGVGGYLTLTGGYAACSSISGHINTKHNHTIKHIYYRRAIYTGTHGVDYTTVNGMISEIEGLAKWSKLTPVTSELLRGENGKYEGVSIVVKIWNQYHSGDPLI